MHTNRQKEDKQIFQREMIIKKQIKLLILSRGKGLTKEIKRFCQQVEV
jgi:hypothetical protein